MKTICDILFLSQIIRGRHICSNDLDSLLFGNIVVNNRKIDISFLSQNYLIVLRNSNKQVLWFIRPSNVGKGFS